MKLWESREVSGLRIDPEDDDLPLSDSLFDLEAGDPPRDLRLPDLDLEAAGGASR